MCIVYNSIWFYKGEKQKQFLQSKYQQQSYKMKQWTEPIHNFFYQRCEWVCTSVYIVQCQCIKSTNMYRKHLSCRNTGKKNKYCAFYTIANYGGCCCCCCAFYFGWFSSRWVWFDNEIQRQTFFHSTISINFMYLLVFFSYW